MERLRTIGSVFPRFWPLWGILLVVLGVLGGYANGSAQRGKFDEKQKARESVILAWIVERNPEATIKDFLGFPATVLRLSADAGIDYRVILAIADKESQMRPRAVGASGEIGLMQLLPATAALVAKRLEDSAYEPPVRGRSGQYASLGSLGDPTVNVRYGIEYLRWQIERFGATPMAVRAYNRNPDRVMEHREGDRYVEDVVMRYFTLAQRLR